MKVFVGSTRRDMHDCRAGVLETLEIYAAEKIVMENWPAEHEDALSVCREKLAASTHYIGLFGYHRGWVPDGWPISITQAEYRAAVATVKRLLVLVPEEGTALAEELRRRAEALQDGPALEQQYDFLADLVGVAEPFRSVAHLVARVATRMLQWRQPTTSLTARPCAICPTEEELLSLGRAEHVRYFRNALPRLDSRGVRRAACFLLHGPRSHGVRHLHDRLVSEVRLTSFQQRVPRHYRVGCDVAWQRRDVQTLLRTMSHELALPVRAANIPALGSHVSRLLEQRGAGDVVLTVSDLQEFDGGVEAFAADFWQPLVASLATEAPGRFICLATHETNTEPLPHGSALIHTGDGPSDDARLLVALPGLEPFTREEIFDFLTSWERVPTDDLRRLGEIADQLAGRSLSPERVFINLSQAATWLPEGE